MTEDRRKRIMYISGHYSKGRGGKRGKEWTEDSENKEKKATFRIREASEIFLYQSYHSLERNEHLNI